MDIAKSLGLSLSRSMQREFTQNFIPVENIHDGIIEVKDGNKKKYVKILEIAPSNFEFQDDSEQKNIIRTYKKWLKLAPDTFQIKTISQRSDITPYLERAQDSFENEKVPECRNWISNYIQLIYNETSREYSTEVRYFLIFSAKDFTSRLAGEKTDEEKMEELNEYTRRIITTFKAMGNSVKDWSSPDEEILKLLYEHYNYSLKEKEPFSLRRDRVLGDYRKIYNTPAEEEPPFLGYRDIIAPKSIGLMESTYMTINNEYRTFLYVDGNGYTDIMSPNGWLSVLINFGLGVDVDIFFDKKDSEDVLNKISTKHMFADYKAKDRTAFSKDANEILGALGAMQYLQESIQQRREDVYDMSVLVTIHASSKLEMEDKKKRILKWANTNNLIMYECKNLQEDAFLSSGFFNSPTDKIIYRTKHNVTSGAVAASYPYTAIRVADKDGVYLGRDIHRMSPVIHNIFDKKYMNFNIVLMGETGSGKTSTVLAYATRMRYHDVQVYVVAPQKQREYLPACEALGGEFIDVSSGETRINWFDVLPIDDSVIRRLYGENAGYSFLSQKINILRTWLKLLCKDIRPAELANLEQVLMEMYEDFGITLDNDSVYYNKETGELKEMPVMEDFYNKLMEHDEISADTRAIINRFVNGAARNLNGQTNVDLDNKFLVFGLQNLDDELMAPTLYSTIQFIWQEIQANPTQKKILIVDEGWDLIGSRDEEVAGQLTKIVKLIRGLGGSFMFATQSPRDLLSSKGSAGEFILTSSYTKMLLHLEKKNVEIAAQALDLSPSECYQIETDLEPGHGLLMCGKTHIPMEVVLSPREKEIFTTNRDDLEEKLR